MKKKLGEANKENIKLRKRLDKSVNDPPAESSASITLTENQESSVVDNCESPVLCSICSVPIMDFKPIFFLVNRLTPPAMIVMTDLKETTLGLTPVAVSIHLYAL